MDNGRREKVIHMAEGNILVLFEFASLTTEQYDNINKELEAVGQGIPTGLLFHAAAVKGDGMLIYDVWESAELFEKFGKETIKPILERLNLELPPPQVYPVYKLLESKEVLQAAQ